VAFFAAASSSPPRRGALGDHRHLTFQLRTRRSPCGGQPLTVDARRQTIRIWAPGSPTCAVKTQLADHRLAADANAACPLPVASGVHRQFNASIAPFPSFVARAAGGAGRRLLSIEGAAPSARVRDYQIDCSGVGGAEKCNVKPLKNAEDIVDALAMYRSEACMKNRAKQRYRSMT
jgi:hypothetical protein